jgi:hypothetical protein
MQVCVRGRCKVQVLAGEVSIMGYTLRANPDGAPQQFDLYSPTTTSHLTITTVAAEQKVQA